MHNHHNASKSHNHSRNADAQSQDLRSISGQLGVNQQSNSTGGDLAVAVRGALVEIICFASLDSVHVDCDILIAVMTGLLME